MDIGKSAESTAALQAQIAHGAHTAVSDRRNRRTRAVQPAELSRFQGLPDNSAAAGNDNTTEAILKVAGSLGVHLDAGSIDRSHRMGRTSPESVERINEYMLISDT